MRKKAETQRDMEKARMVEQQNEDLKCRVKELRDRIVGLQKVCQALGIEEEEQQHGHRRR